MCSPMFVRIILLFLYLIQNTFSNESPSDNFVVVSTTNRPPPSDNTEELTNRLRLLESQDVVIQKLLDAYNSDLSDLKDNLRTQTTQNQKTLDAYNSDLSHLQKNLETHATQDQKMLHEYNSNLSDLKENLETQIAQNQKMLDVHKSDMSHLKENLQTQVTQNQKIQDAYNSNLSHLKDNLQVQIDQIQKKLESIERNSHQTKNPNKPSLPRSCKEVQERGHNVTDVYFIQPEMSPEPFLVLCNMETKGGGWTYILNRFNGTQDFGLNWDSYKLGFGLPDGEYWLGLDNVHYLTGSQMNELLVELVDWDEVKAHALYSAFSIGNEQEGYYLKLLRGYNGDAGDSLTYHLGMKFSTKDKDQDLSVSNCAAYSPAAWWYKNCDKGQLTGKYLKIVNSGDRDKGIYWNSFRTGDHSLKEAKMMVRPVL